MDKTENSAGISGHWIYPVINPVFKLLSVNQIALNNCKSVKFELCHFTL